MATERAREENIIKDEYAEMLEMNLSCYLKIQKEKPGRQTPASLKSKSPLPTISWRIFEIAIPVGDICVPT